MSLPLKTLRPLRCLMIESKPLHTSSKLNTFWVSDDKGGYKGGPEMPSLIKRFPEGLQELKKEFALFRKELWEDFHCVNSPLTVRQGEIDVLWKFGDEKCLDSWVTSADSDFDEGYSKCGLSLTKDGNGLFAGELCKNIPKDGRLARAGYCSMKTKTFRKSFKREIYLDWSLYNVLNMRVRGDGRSYFVNIGTKGYFDIMWNDIYHYALFTRGGPYWQTVRIPFSKFFLSSRGRIQDKQCPLPQNMISSFSFTLADKVNGPFALEIEYIGVEYDRSHKEKFAYEMYETDANIAAN